MSRKRANAEDETGVVSYRGWLYDVERGRSVHWSWLGLHGDLDATIPVHPTAPHALSHANTELSEAEEENARREREARAQFDALDETDKEILRLSQVYCSTVFVPHRFSIEARGAGAGRLVIRERAQTGRHRRDGQALPNHDDA